MAQVQTEMTPSKPPGSKKEAYLPCSTALPLRDPTPEKALL